MQTNTNATFVVAIVWGLASCDAHDYECESSGDGNACEHDHSEIPNEYAELINPLSGELLAIANGGQVYRENCVDCHGVDATGNGPLGRTMTPRPANLMALWHRHDVTDGFIYWRIAEGGANNRSAMPSWEDTLSGDDIWRVISYLECVADPTCAFPPNHARSHRGSQ